MEVSRYIRKIYHLATCVQEAHRRSRLMYFMLGTIYIFLIQVAIK